MSQRLMGERQRRLLAILPSGKYVFSISGAEPDPEKPDEKSSEGNEVGGEGEGTGGGSEGGTPTPRVYTEDEVAAITRRMQAADRAKAEAERKIREYEDKDKSELEKAQRDAKEAQERLKQTESQLLKTRIHNKFLASNKYTWHDPETALALLDLENVKVEDDGKVTGLDDAIKALADAKPFLIKTEDKGKEKPKGGKPSGNNPPSNPGGNGGRNTDRARLEEKYPALRR